MLVRPLRNGIESNLQQSAEVGPPYQSPRIRSAPTRAFLPNCSSVEVKKEEGGEQLSQAHYMIKVCCARGLFYAGALNLNPAFPGCAWRSPYTVEES